MGGTGFLYSANDCTKSIEFGMVVVTKRAAYVHGKKVALLGFACFVMVYTGMQGAGWSQKSDYSALPTRPALPASHGENVTKQRSRVERTVSW